MAFYRIEWKQSAEKDLRRLPKDIIARILNQVESLCENPTPPGSRKLSGSERLYRIRVSGYRIVYALHSTVLVIEVIRVRHRSDVYGNLP